MRNLPCYLLSVSLHTTLTDGSEEKAIRYLNNNESKTLTLYSIDTRDFIASGLVRKKYDKTHAKSNTESDTIHSNSADVLLQR